MPACLFEYIYIYIYVCIYVCIHIIYIYIYIYIYKSAHVYMGLRVIVDVRKQQGCYANIELNYVWMCAKQTKPAYVAASEVYCI